MCTKIYIHHYYSKSLFYKILHNTTNRKYFLKNDIGYITCKYNGIDFKVVFDPELNNNEDGYHLIDFLTILNQLNRDAKYSEIDCVNRKKGEDAHRGKWGAEFGINDTPIAKWIADQIETKSNWLVLFLRTEKSFIKYDGINYPTVSNLESQISRLKNHKVITDNCFINPLIENRYPNHHFVLTNTIHQWNELLSIRWYYEFKNVFEKLNPPYDLCFSMRYHKRNRTDIINGLSKLDNPKIYLSRVDNCPNDDFYKNNKNLSKVSNINFNVTNGDNFNDLDWIENIEHYLDYIMRILPMAKMHIVSETWDWFTGNLASNYLSEKTYGLLLSNIPFVPTNTYPLDILHKIIGLEKYPLYDDIKLVSGNPIKFVEYIDKFMNNFDSNYLTIKKWVNDYHTKLMEKIDTENSLLDLIIADFPKTTFVEKKSIL